MTLKLKAATPDRRPRHALVEMIENKTASFEALLKERDALFEQKISADGAVSVMAKKLEASRADFLEIKQRLLAAELANERLRGYLARVQEDDIVREELVTIGEPDGEQQLKPKRKHTAFPDVAQLSDARTDVSSPAMGADRFYRERATQKPRCWVNY